MKLPWTWLYAARAAACGALAGELVLFWWLDPTSLAGYFGCVLLWLLTYAVVDETVRFWWWE